MKCFPAFWLVASLWIATGVLSPAYAQVPSSDACVVAAPAGVSDHGIQSGEYPRTYRLFVPPSSGSPMPLVLDLHGSGRNAAYQARVSGLETLAAREHFVVATLEADTGGRWNVPVTAERADDVLYVSDVIADVSAIACIDPSRIYATGFSGGARMTSLLGCRLHDQIAAIAPVAGLRWPAPCEGRPVPVLTFHGLADRQNPYEGYVANRGAEWEESVPEATAGWAQHNGCDPAVILEDPAGPLSTVRYDGCEAGAEVRVIRIDDLGHTWPKEEVDATALIWEFFSRYRLGDESQWSEQHPYGSNGNAGTRRDGDARQLFP